MSETEVASNVGESDEDSPSTTTPEWGANAPPGAKAVFGRIIKEGANVPLFLGQTLINTLRDTGYNTTTSACCEHVDNAIESGATEIRVYFAESGARNRRTYNVLVLDNGAGMSPNVLKAVCAFGGSMRFDNRNGIGRYGMGMKAAALSMAPVLEVYSWQEPGAFYNMTLDVKAIGQDKRNVILLPDAELHNTLPAEIVLILSQPMSYPKNADESQAIFCYDSADLRDRLGRSGTIVLMPSCDRLTYRKTSTLVDDATREMSRVYRRQLDRGLSLYINNRRVEAFDPTYQMTSARHHALSDLNGREKSSRLVNRWEIPVPISEESTETRVAVVRLYFLPIHDWSGLSRKVLKNDLKVFDLGGISFMRSDREVDMKHLEGIVGKRNARDTWWRMEVEFHGDLDEAFGVAMTKQGVRPKNYVLQLIKKEIQGDLRTVRRMVDKHWSDQVVRDSQSKVTAAEQRANEAEALQSTLLPQPVPKTPEEQKSLEENLRTLASGLKRSGESDEQAFERVKASRFITTYKNDEDAAFYRVDFKLGKVILTINTAHAFYERLYKPLTSVARAVTETGKGSDGSGDSIDGVLAEECSQVIVNLQLLLLSLGRTQTEMTVADTSGELQKVFDKLRRQWSLNLDTQLSNA